jgi:hypothetical protein
MASYTQILKTKRANRRKNAGKRRKAIQSKKSTASYDELFAACGEPGKPAPK